MINTFGQYLGIRRRLIYYLNFSFTNFQTVFTVVACDADPDAYYYYGGPGYYHGYYSSGFKKYPSFYFNQRKRRDAMYQHQSQTYVSLLKPYR